MAYKSTSNYHVQSKQLTLIYEEMNFHFPGVRKEPF